MIDESLCVDGGGVCVGGVIFTFVSILDVVVFVCKLYAVLYDFSLANTSLVLAVLAVLAVLVVLAVLAVFRCFALLYSLRISTCISIGAFVSIIYFLEIVSKYL